MTAATHRRSGLRGSAVRWTWAGVVALLAALAVLVHHDMTSPAMSPPALSAMSPMPGMDHGSSAMTEATVPGGHDAAFQVTGMAMGGDAGACSGMAMQHCSAGDIVTAKLVPPPVVTHVDRAEAIYGVSAGHGPRAEPDRPPPDLSVLSRLLI